VFLKRHTLIKLTTCN